MFGAATDKAHLLRLSLVLGTKRSLFQMFGAATDKAHLLRLSLVLGTKSCHELDDLSCLGRFDRHKTLA